MINKMIGKILSLIMVGVMVSGCVADTCIICIKFPGNKTKLEKFPKEVPIDDLDISHITYLKDQDLEKIGIYKSKYNINILEAVNNGLIEIPKDYRERRGCILEVSRNFYSPYKKDGAFGYIYIYISALTLSIIPYYYIEHYETKAKLIDAKTGKVLKKYNFQENTYDIISIIALPFFLLIESTTNKKYGYDEGDLIFIAQNKTSQALIRSITNDAYQFPQCYKNPDPENIAKIQEKIKLLQQTLPEPKNIPWLGEEYRK